MWELPQFRNPRCKILSPFTTPNELSCLMYNCVCLTDRTYCIGTASQSIVKYSHSGQLEPMKMNAEHTLAGGSLQALASPPPPNIEIKKKRSFVDTMLTNVLCDLPFSQTQPLKLADD